MFFPENLDFLPTLLSYPRIGIITDMDGTISPIVPAPDQAQITPRNRELLAALRECVTLVAVVSGRAASDVHERVGLEGLVYFGNHGMERWTETGLQQHPAVVPYRPALDSAIRDLTPYLLPGMLLEDKGATVSVHYRQTGAPAAAARQFAPHIQSIATLYELRVTEGRMVFELRPPVNVHKGTVLRQLINEYQLEAALFLGDDATDADALLATRELRAKHMCYAFGVGVLSVDMPEVVRASADVMVPGVVGIERLLDAVLSALSASVT